MVFSCEFCEISKNTFFTEHLWMSASETKTRQIGHIIRIILTEYQYQYQSIIGGSGSEKTNALINLINHEDSDEYLVIDKIYLYTLDAHEPKYQLLIKKHEDAGENISMIQKLS